MTSLKGEVGLTADEQHVLSTLALRPMGAFFRSEELRKAVLSLAGRQFVCDPHAMIGALFTRITEEGRAAIAKAAALTSLKD